MRSAPGARGPLAALILAITVLAACASSGREDGPSSGLPAPAAAPRGDPAAALAADVRALEAELDAMRPGVDRLLEIENDIRILLAQLAALTETADAPASGTGPAPFQPLSPTTPRVGPDPPAEPPIPIAQAPPTNRPISVDPLASPEDDRPRAPAPAPPDDPPAPSPMAGVYAHLASYRSVESAEAGWAELRTAHATALAGLSPRIEAADLGERGVFQRLYAGPFALEVEAATACAYFESRDLYCQVTRLE